MKLRCQTREEGGGVSQTREEGGCVSPLQDKGAPSPCGGVSSPGNKGGSPEEGEVQGGGVLSAMSVEYEPLGVNRCSGVV